jgi:hypothetical protein
LWGGAVVLYLFFSSFAQSLLREPVSRAGITHFRNMVERSAGKYYKSHSTLHIFKEIAWPRLPQLSRPSARSPHTHIAIWCSASPSAP